MLIKCCCPIGNHNPILNLSLLRLSRNHLYDRRKADGKEQKIETIPFHC